MKSNYLTSVSFSDFALNPDLDSALSTAGFTHCTEIQQLSMPLMLEGKDIAAQSQTGTGKTAAYLLNNPPEEDLQPTELRAIILAPTREPAGGRPSTHRIACHHSGTNPRTCDTDS